MAEDSGNAGLGLIVGIIAVVVIVILALGVGPRIFTTSAPTQVTIEAPKAPVPAPKS